MIITRFAPSPTGEPHIGNIRIALINYIFAKSNNGKMLLRFEDTDKERSDDKFVDSMKKTLGWLEIKYDEKEIFQSSRAEKHKELARQLLNEGKAYKEFSEENPSPDNYAIKLKIPTTGVETIIDLIKGKVSFDNKQLNDIVLLRSDGSPTYMFAVVVDDHDMKITHVIRGDDHMTNTFKQKHIYESFG